MTIVEPTISDVLTSIADMHESIVDTLQRLDSRVGGLERQFSTFALQMAEAQETLGDLVEAEGKDALATINHEERITLLEKRSGIPPLPVAHLREID